MKGVGDAGVGGNKSADRRERDEPLERVVSVNAKRAGEDVFLIVGDVQKQLAEERLRALGIVGIKNAVAAIFLLVRRRGVVGIVRREARVITLGGIFVDLGGVTWVE